MDAIIARAGEKGLDHFRPSTAPPPLPAKKSDPKAIDSAADAFEPARTRLKVKIDPLAAHLVAPMARDQVALRKPKRDPVSERLDTMLKKHPGVAERAYLAEAILHDVPDPGLRYGMTERLLRRHPELIPLFALNTLARPVEKWWGNLENDLAAIWREAKTEWRRLINP